MTDQPKKTSFANLLWLLGGGGVLLMMLAVSALSSSLATSEANPSSPPTPPAQPQFNQPHPELDSALDIGYGLLSSSVQARADALMQQARESGNVRLYLASQLLDNQTKLQTAQTKLGVLSGSAHDIQIARDRVGDIVAILRCFEMLQKGESPMAQGIQPNELLLYLEGFEADLVGEFPNLAKDRSLIPPSHTIVNARELVREREAHD